jgi:hypothetical protein
MTKDPTPQSSADLDQILESAHRLGVEIDEEEAIQWLTAMAAANAEDEDIIVDIQSGVFGHRVSMLDFSPDDLAHFRKIGELVEFKDVPDQVETALALSGSAAQSKIQAYPGDADYFERINIIAESREEACGILAKIMRDKALSTEKGATYQLIEVKFGNYPLDVIKDGEPAKYGSPISWKPADIRAGQIDAFKHDGTPVVIDWEQVALDPGWCKLDWVIADTVRGQLSNASNMLDVTWEAPDGKITPLDGYLDPYFQEVYLEAASVPIFSKLAKNVSGDALDEYVDQLEKEVTKYLTKDINYGKAAKRMYNIFRLIGKYQEAAFLRELFDEPTTMLYQVWSFIRTIDDCCNPETSINQEDMLAHADNLIMSVITSLEGDQETEVVRKLLRLRDALTRQEENIPLTPEAEAARAEVINIVNNFFYERLTAVPTIKAYMSEFE